MTNKTDNDLAESMKKVRDYAEKHKKSIENEQSDATQNPDEEPSGKMSWPQDELNTRRELDD